MTFASSLLPIVDELAGYITLPAGMTADLGAQPAQHLPDRFYLWPRTQEFVPEGDGSLDLGNFRLRASWSIPGGGEAMPMLRLRAVSDLIDAGVQTVVDAVRAHRTSATWESLLVDEVTYDAIVTFDVRAAWIDISGYRLVGA